MNDSTGARSTDTIDIATWLDLVALRYAVRLYVAYSDHLARAMFRFSIVYLAALFSALLLDHYGQQLF